ncbi:MAG: glutamate 5-kinase [Kiritimatiellae bacterium]|nr:glutamate 5-kinase [Kiritimatiellia bacterium]MBQ6142824.1 glutamate 5-kinase [Kiritimatiellia bacterium]
MAGEAVVRRVCIVAGGAAIRRQKRMRDNFRRVVVKVGTHAIANRSGRPDRAALRRIVEGLCSLRDAGCEVVFVSSGAVAAGVEALGLPARPTAISDVQMCAAVGQARFICEYERLFAERGVKIGQVLLTHADFEGRRSSGNVRNSLDHLVKAGIVPVVNENDVVSDDEIRGNAFGDNDWLSFLIAKLIKADALVLLTTVDGLLDSNGRRIPEVVDLRGVARLVRAGEKGRLSKGGMDSKLKAVKAAVAAGIDTFIANGRRAVLPQLAAGRAVGTYFPGSAL